ncbi:uncharacterized protein LOC143229874 [Tachypleus tridentatus]|uniref:uncharacterized protein LOC143229874 n=1 Tax=Tachypleus tridentatus TaxID=6853 RepID=UPI003FD02BCC
MKTLYLVAILFVGVVFAEEKEELKESESYAYPVGYHGYGYAPYYGYGAYGHGYGGYGHLGAAYGAHGYGGLAASARHGAYGYGAHGLKANAAHRNLNAYGAHGGYAGRYHDIGAYARNKGSGYTKAYAYDKRLVTITVVELLVAMVLYMVSMTTTVVLTLMPMANTDTVPTVLLT